MCKSSKGFFPSDIFSRGHATLHLAMSVGKLVRRSVTFLNSKRFLHYCSCPTVRDWIRPCFMLTQVDFIFSFHLFLLLIGETPGAVVSNVTLPSRNSKLYRRGYEQQIQLSWKSEFSCQGAANLIAEEHQT